MGFMFTEWTGCPTNGPDVLRMDRNVLHVTARRWIGVCLFCSFSFLLFEGRVCSTSSCNYLSFKHLFGYITDRANGARGVVEA